MFSSSSEIPSLKYSLSGSGLMLVNGSTAIDGSPDVSAAWPVEPLDASSISSAPVSRSAPGSADSSASGVYLIPAGVKSYAQASTTATGNPRMSKNVTRLPTQAGSRSVGATTSTI
jgi:hypothetical protein